MKLAQRSALLCLTMALVPVAVACGSTDSLGLFSTTAGGASTSLGGASSSGGAPAQAGHGAGGNISASGGSGGSNAGAGQGTAGSNTGGKGAAGSGAAGSGGKGGSGGASGGSAGASGGRGGGAGAGTGGSNAGSGGSVAGTGGSAGGAGMSGCAPRAPVAGATCAMPTPNGCFYPGLDCDCMPRNGGGTFRGTWVCIGSGTPLCPQDLPSTGGACPARNGAQCPYSSMDVCTCAPDMTLKWDCSADKNFNCPPQAPMAGANCAVEAMCQYLDGDCFCNGTRWVCQG